MKGTKVTYAYAERFKTTKGLLIVSLVNIGRSSMPKAQYMVDVAGAKSIFGKPLNPSIRIPVTERKNTEVLQIPVA